MSATLDLRAPGILLVHDGNGPRDLHSGLWSRNHARKTGKCAVSGEPIRIGDLVYRPVTNGLKRAQRILASKVEP